MKIFPRIHFGFCPRSLTFLFYCNMSRRDSTHFNDAIRLLLALVPRSQASGHHPTPNLKLLATPFIWCVSRVYSISVQTVSSGQTMCVEEDDDMEVLLSRCMTRTTCTPPVHSKPLKSCHPTTHSDYVQVDYRCIPGYLVIFNRRIATRGVTHCPQE